MKITLDNIIDEIVKLIPEFKQYGDYNVFDITDVSEKKMLLGVFGRFLKERVENYPINDKVIQKFYLFLNEQFNEQKNDKDTTDLIIIDIFETLAESYKAIEVSRQLLKGKALWAFNEAEKYI
jgi:hypothetical protein